MISMPDNLLSQAYQGVHWQMTSCERFAIQHILNHLKPEKAIEVGTYKGGSLQVLAAFCNSVDSIDIDPSVKETLEPLFGNVRFYTGNSSAILPVLLQKHIDNGVPVEFILIDGDHSTQGVKRDIESVIAIKPEKQLIILMHDSFNPACRKGMITADWQSSPYVHQVEIDFIPGIFHERAYDTASAGSMWGGFAIGILQPEKREGELVVSQKQQGLFEAVYKASSYNKHKETTWASLKSKVSSAYKRIIR
jgi:hypothetical protein